MILKDIAGNNLDLSKSHNFVTHYNSNASCANIIMRQLNDKNIFEFLRGYKDLTILDIGANIGLFSLFCSPIAKNIYSIEPTPSHFNLFKELLDLTNITNVTPFNLGIHYETGTIKFNIHDQNSTMNSFVECTSHSGRTIDVNTKTLCDFIDENNCGLVDFIKMDIEGLETDIITHESFQLVKDKFRAMHIEVHNFRGESMDDNLKLIRKAVKPWNKTITQLAPDSILIH
jgi:FkbM family methyltransferase